MFNFKLFEAGSLGSGGISEAVLTLGLLTLSPQRTGEGIGMFDFECLILNYLKLEA